MGLASVTPNLKWVIVELQCALADYMLFFRWPLKAIRFR